MAPRPEQPGPQPALSFPEREASGIEQRLEDATDRIGGRFEELMAYEPHDRAEAEAILDELEYLTGPLDAIERNSHLMGLSDVDLLAHSIRERGAESRKKVIAVNHGTEKPAAARQREYDRAEAIGANTSLSGPGKKTRPSAAVVRHWMGRSDNRARLEAFQADIEARLDDLPDRPRRAA